MNPDSDTLELTYDLFDLPTSQHKAGLAGLLVLVESMRRRRINPLPGLDVAQTRARVVLTKESLQSLLDELYDASVEEIMVRTPWDKLSLLMLGGVDRKRPRTEIRVMEYPEDAINNLLAMSSK